MKDLLFALIMVMAGIFCALIGNEILIWVGGILTAIGVVAALVSEFGGGIKNNPNDDK